MEFVVMLSVMYKASEQFSFSFYHSYKNCQRLKSQRTVGQWYTYNVFHAEVHDRTPDKIAFNRKTAVAVSSLLRSCRNARCCTVSTALVCTHTQNKKKRAGAHSVESPL